MGFEGWDDVCPYDYKITPDNVFIVYNNNVEVYRSRAFRLKVQAENKAQKWIDKKIGKVKKANVVLDVQNGAAGSVSKIRR